MSDEKPALRKILENPLISGMIGFLMATLLWLYPWVLIGTLVIGAMVIVAFRDRIDFGSYFGLSISKKKERKELEPCKECGSRTKHKRTCSHYGETVRKHE